MKANKNSSTISWSVVHLKPGEKLGAATLIVHCYRNVLLICIGLNLSQLFALAFAQFTRLRHDPLPPTEMNGIQNFSSLACISAVRGMYTFTPSIRSKIIITHLPPAYGLKSLLHRHEIVLVLQRRWRINLHEFPCAHCCASSAVFWRVERITVYIV